MRTAFIIVLMNGKTNSSSIPIQTSNGAAITSCVKHAGVMSER